MDHLLAKKLRAYRAAEAGEGTRRKDAPLRVVLAYPSPYRAAMSSLGYLQVLRLTAARPLISAERAVLPSDEDLERHRATRTPLSTLESERPAAEAHVLAFSLSYELELAGVATMLELAGLAPLARDRGAGAPLVVLGGPLTFSNPLPAAPLADVLLLGEAEATWPALLARLEERPEAARGSSAAREALLDELATKPGYYVPSRHGEELPPIAQADDVLLPARSEIWTPNAELADMFLIEPERGCHRGCTFCVMRRSTNGGMRLVPPAEVLALVPDGVRRVGLVGAAVSDHPRIKEILRGLVDERHKEVGLSSLRADRLDEELVGLLARGGYRSLTVALDAASSRLMEEIEKNLKLRHIERAAELARGAGLRHLKLYVMLGLPGETAEDVDELIRFARALRRVLPLVLGVSPFVPKFHTPLADAPFVGEERAAQLLSQLRRGLAGQVEIRGPSAREAYVEYRLAQGGHAHAQAAIAAARAGGGLGAWRRALCELPERVRPAGFARLVPPPTRKRRAAPLPLAAGL